MTSVLAVGYFANEPDRLACALHELRSTLVAPPACAGVGMAHFMDDRLLLNLKPSPVQPGASMEDLVGLTRTHALLLGLHGGGDIGPFKFRHWAFFLHGGAGRDAVKADLGARLPDFLKRNLAGDSVGELAFHRVLSVLHDKANVEDPNVDVRVVGAALEEVLGRVDPGSTGGVGMVISNGRVMVGIHRGGGMAYSLREGILACQRCQADGSLDPFPVRESHRRFKGVVLASGLGQVPAGFQEVPAGRPVAVTRKLDLQLL